eukprot:3310775-Pleurochrysis_carterae.AAC.1
MAERGQLAGTPAGLARQGGVAGAARRGVGAPPGQRRRATGTEGGVRGHRRGWHPDRDYRRQRRGR